MRSNSRPRASYELDIAPVGSLYPVTRGWGMQHDDCSFVLDDMLGFEPGFGKCDYAWDADRPKMRWMLSVADKFISSMMGSERPACLIWDPI